MIWKKSCIFAASYPENNLFTLMETNTYWRFGAVACEGHRFFLFIHLLHQIAYSIYCSQEERIQLKGNITIVGRLAEPSHNFSEGIFLNQRSRILKPKETSSWTREVVSLNLMRHIIEPKETYHWTRGDVSLSLRKYIIEPNKEHYTIHESLIW